MRIYRLQNKDGLGPFSATPFHQYMKCLASLHDYLTPPYDWHIDLSKHSLFFRLLKSGKLYFGYHDREALVNAMTDKEIEWLLDNGFEEVVLDVPDENCFIGPQCQVAFLKEN